MFFLNQEKNVLVIWASLSSILNGDGFVKNEIFIFNVLLYRISLKIKTSFLIYNGVPSQKVKKVEFFLK